MEENKGGETTTENIEELKSQIATLTSEKNGMVGELTEDRKKRQELQLQIEDLKTALEAATKANATATDPSDITNIVKSTVEATLAEKEASIAKSNKSAAIEKFVSEHKEFHTDNDPTGKKREALNSAIARFNDNGLKTVEQFYSLVGDAARLLGVENTAPQTTAQTIDNPYSSIPRVSVTPKVSTDSDLSPQELKLIEKNKMTKETYLNLKAKNPAYAANLVSYIS